MSTAKRQQLREFGLLTGTLIGAVLGGLFPWMKGHPYPAWPWLVGVTLAGFAVIYPAALDYPFAIWTAVGKSLGWINSRLILTVLFFAVVTPLGFVLRLLGRDAMARHFDRGAQTYRTRSRRASIQSLERPF